jgi:hypothetical protein
MQTQISQQLQTHGVSQDIYQQFLQTLTFGGNAAAVGLLSQLRQGHGVPSLLQHSGTTSAVSAHTRLTSTSHSTEKFESSAEELLAALKHMSDAECLQVIRRIKEGDSASTILRRMKEGDLRLQHSLVPETRRYYQFPYLLKISNFLRTADNPYLAPLVRAVDSKASLSPEDRPLLESGHETRAYEYLYSTPYRAAEVVDPHLAKASTQKWTTVIDDDRLLAQLLNVFFLHHFPIFPCLHKESFLKDMAANRSRFCSPLLVNTVLAAACHAHEGIPDRAKFWSPQNLAYRFSAEAKRLWESQDGRVDLPTIQAAILLNVISNSDSMDRVGRAYMTQAVGMAHDMQLFKAPSPEESKELQRVRTFTAWCLFAWDSLQSFYFFRQPFFPHPPEFPLPDPQADGSWYSEIRIQYPLNSEPVPVGFGAVFKATLEFRSIVHDISARFFTSPTTNTHLQDSDNIADISEFCSRLQNWFNGLPAPLTEKNITFPSHIRLHLEYHTTLITLLKSAKGQAPLRVTMYDSMYHSPEKLISQAYIRIETLVRLYYTRHSLEAYDSFMMYYLVFLGNHVIDSLEQGCPPHYIDAYRSTLILCARSLYDQGLHIYLTQLVYSVLRNRMPKRERDLLLTYIKDGPAEDQQLILQHTRSQFPLPIIKINEDPSTAYISQLVEEYEGLSMHTTSESGEDNNSS